MVSASTMSKPLNRDNTSACLGDMCVLVAMWLQIQDGALNGWATIVEYKYRWS